MNTIVVPTDFSKESAAAFSQARAQANLDTKIHLVHVIEAPSFALAPAEFGIGYVDMTPVLAELESSGRKKLQELTLEHFPGLQVECHLLRGSDPVYEQVLALAEKTGATLLVVATHGRKGFERFLLGSVTERIIRGAKCPVLVVPVQ